MMVLSKVPLKNAKGEVEFLIGAQANVSTS